MPTPKKGPRLGGSAAHQRLMLRNLATALFEHERITTTESRAKTLRPYAERLITFAKRGDLHARRRVMTQILDKGVVHKLFTELGPDFAAREGGYTRITRVGPRKGDNAMMAVIELVREPVASTKRATKATSGAAPKAAEATPVAAEAETTEVETTEVETTEAETTEVETTEVETTEAETTEVETTEAPEAEGTVAADEVPTEMAAEAAAEAPVVEEAPAAPAADASEDTEKK